MKQQCTAWILGQCHPPSRSQTASSPAAPRPGQGTGRRRGANKKSPPGNAYLAGCGVLLLDARIPPKRHQRPGSQPRAVGTAPSAAISGKHTQYTTDPAESQAPFRRMVVPFRWKLTWLCRCERQRSNPLLRSWGSFSCRHLPLCPLWQGGAGTMAFLAPNRVVAESLDRHRAAAL